MAAVFNDRMRTDNSSKLAFEPISLSMKERLTSYFFRYGEGSCQHSFASMYCLFEKYQDHVCELDGWILIRRDGLRTEKDYVCLCPIGDPSDTLGFQKAVTALLQDAHIHGKKLQFMTATDSARERIQTLFPDQFQAEELRDFAEYIYDRDKLVKMSGSRMFTRRKAFRRFQEDYQNRLRIERITSLHKNEILRFQKEWLQERYEATEHQALCIEQKAIERALSVYEELDLCGIVLYIDAKICGYLIGHKISEDTFDAMFGKADRSYPNIYTGLYREAARICGADCRRINWEEDLGDQGLRTMKLIYRPEVLLNKFCIREADG